MGNHLQFPWAKLVGPVLPLQASDRYIQLRFLSGSPACGDLELCQGCEPETKEWGGGLMSGPLCLR